MDFGAFLCVGVKQRSEARTAPDLCFIFNSSRFYTFSILYPYADNYCVY